MNVRHLAFAGLAVIGMSAAFAQDAQPAPQTGGAEVHGYPAALVRYDRGAVLRTAIAWTAGRAVRLDGFADTAVVRDPGFGRGLRNYTGFGAALEAPAPFRTLLSIEWGYGLQGVDTTGGRGTNVVRIAAYKVF